MKFVEVLKYKIKKKRVKILTSKSSRVKRLFWAWASCLFNAYSAQTRCESMNSLSHGCQETNMMSKNWRKYTSTPYKYEEWISNYLYISIKIWNQLVLFMAHSTPKVSYTNVCLLAVTEVTLRNQYMTHRKHAKSSDFLWSVENDRREPEGRLSFISTEINFQLEYIILCDQ